MAFFDFLIPGRTKINLQASEGNAAEDITTTSITNSRTETPTVDKNNYNDYASQTRMINSMYNACSDYGGGLLRPIIDTRTSFIMGEGVSIVAENDETQKYIDEFLQYNKLKGSALLDAGTLGEMEGKALFIFSIDQKNQKVKTNTIPWNTRKYDVTPDPKDRNEYKSVKLSKIDKAGIKEEILNNKYTFHYVKIGGSPDRVNETTTATGVVLTEVENASRALYDLRKSNHLFSRPTPYFKTETNIEAKGIRDAIGSTQWTPGKAFAGAADYSLTGPAGTAADTTEKEILLNLKVISAATTIPIHWLSWPELMSNRATAENLLEVINAGTKKARLIWEENIKEIILKSMTIASDAGFGVKVDDNFQVKLPLSSMSTLQAIQSTWVPLWQIGAISMATLRNRIPEIDPTEEEGFIKMENDETASRGSLKLNTNIRSGNDEESGEDTNQAG